MTHIIEQIADVENRIDGLITFFETCGRCCTGVDGDYEDEEFPDGEPDEEDYDDWNRYNERREEYGEAESYYLDFLEELHKLKDSKEYLDYKNLTSLPEHQTFNDVKDFFGIDKTISVTTDTNNIKGDNPATINYSCNMKKSIDKIQVIDETVLFPNLEKEKSFPEPIYCEGAGKLENGRLIVSIKLTSDLKSHIKNSLISFTVFKRKEVSMYGATHSTVINQQAWPDNRPKSKDFVTVSEGSFDKAITFTLSLSQLKDLAYDVPGKGQFIKLEFVDNGMQVGVFRYLSKKVLPEIVAFKKATTFSNTLVMSDPKAEAQSTIDDFINGL